jgi:tetratricopeptide (TPR) repeat protein
MSLDETIGFLKNVDELKVAETLLDTFAKYARNAEQLNDLGKGYHDIKRYAKAIAVTENALSTSSSNEFMYALRANLAKLYNHINDPEKALFYLNINDRLTPNDPDVSLERVFSLFLLGRRSESEEILREMVKHELPDDVMNRVLFNLGTYDLYRGKLQEGLRGFLLTGKKLGIWKKVELPFKFWEGGIQLGKTLIILAEGGIGDEFINVRFMKHLKDYGMHPIWYTTRKDIASIFNRCGFETITDLKDAPKDSLWTYSMSLPIYLDLQKKDLWYGPYLTVNEASKPKFEFMNNSSKPKIGIRWSGNPDYEHDLHRSLQLDQLIKAFDGLDVELYSLQRDDGADAIKKYPDVIDLSGKLMTYDDTLASMENLDIIVSSCTSIVHAAASLGKTTYVLTPLTEYYVWAIEEQYKTYWYDDNLTMLKQVKHKSWDEPLNKLRELITVNK